MSEIEAALLGAAQMADEARTRLGNGSFEPNPSPLNARKGGSRTPVDVQKHPMSSSVIGNGRRTVQSLPVELLAEIFMRCVSTPPLINEPTKPPRSLCSVCRSWKNTAYNLPGLWAAVSIDLDVISSGAYKMLPDLLDRWFSRATPLPLAFKLKSYDPLPEVNETLTASVVPFAHRLRHLDIDIPYFVSQIGTDPESPVLLSRAAQNSSLDDSRAIRFPVLESVIMRDFIEVYRGQNLPLFPIAPCLQRVRMDCLAFMGGTPAQLALPWSQLTHLILECPLEPYCWQQILLTGPKLQHGLFQIFPHSSEGNPPTTRVVVLNYLVELTLTFNQSFDPRILNPFDFPALVTLRIETYEADEYEENFSIGTAGQQLAPLRRLSLRGLPPFSLLLEATSHVVELELSLIKYAIPYGGFLSFLHPDQGGHLLVPNLKVLTVELPDECSESETTTIVDIIKSRRRPKLSTEEGRGIERLVAFLDSRKRAEVTRMNMVRRKLQPFVDNGLLLDFKDKTSVHWYGRLDPAATEWHEGMRDLFQYH